MAIFSKYRGNAICSKVSKSGCINREQLALVRDADEKWFVLKDFETSKIQNDANFKNFKLEGDILTFTNNNFFNVLFESPSVFDLKQIIK